MSSFYKYTFDLERSCLCALDLQCILILADAGYSVADNCRTNHSVVSWNGLFARSDFETIQVKEEMGRKTRRLHALLKAVRILNRI